MFWADQRFAAPRAEDTLVLDRKKTRALLAVLAVDPSSKRSGGSLLGDRVRIQHDPKDDGILIRSTAAGSRLGGLAEATRDAAQALVGAFDVVVVETCGGGGYGPPEERDPAARQRDRSDGYV